MADTNVARLPDQPAPVPELEMPTTVTLSTAPDMRFSPNDIRQLKEQTGKTLAELTGEGADEADQMQTMAWLRLRRLGHRPLWADCGDVTLEFQTEQPDPTSGEPSTTSPDSAATGA